MITEHSICTVPWDDAGAFLRLSVTYEAADEAAEDALMAETEERLRNFNWCSKSTRSPIRLRTGLLAAKQSWF